MSNDGERLYVTNGNGFNPSTVSVINTLTNEVISSLQVGSGPISAAISHEDKKLYVANLGSGNVSVLDTATGSTINTIKTGSSTSDVSISNDGNYLYAANYGSSSISVINLSTYTSNEIATVDMPWSIVYVHKNVIALTKPASKDECKNNRWSTFTAIVYQNEGQCVSSFRGIRP